MCKLVRCKGLSFFCLGTVGEVGVRLEPNVAGPETLCIRFYESNTPYDAFENQIGPGVWPS